MNTKKKKKLLRRTALHNSVAAKAELAFIEHLHELRRRLYYIVISIVVFGGIIYSVEQSVVRLLLRPAHGQHFIYTNPGGGIDFLFRVCLYSGLVLSLPVIVYNALRFIEPLITNPSRRFILVGSFVSGLLAAAGVVFGYYIGLPAALHFLLHQFTTIQIQPLLTIQSYLSFVIVYMVSSALLFQLPLILLFINRVKPLKPKRLLHYERWVILAAFVLAGLMNPTPNILSQLLVAGPFILMYQVGILLIAVMNRPRRSSHQKQLFTPQSVLETTTATISEIPTTRPLVSTRPRLIMDVVRRPSTELSRTRHQSSTRRPIERTIAIRPRQRFMDFVPHSTQSLASEI